MAPRAEGVRQRVNECMSKLSDRDTEPMAASELDAIARALTPDGLPPFLSAISDARPTDKAPLRRHSLRLLSLLSALQPAPALQPHLPRMLSSALRRLRDTDSSVRAACVDAVRAMAAAHPSALGPVLLRPLTDALFHEQDRWAQGAAALSLAAAIDAVGCSDPEVAHQLQRLVPRLMKLLRSAAFKAKPALLSLLGSIANAGGASTPALLGVLVPCLVEFLSSEDWAARKAAAEALSRLALSERDLLGGFKSSCISSFESRRFDKVKIVRESMNRMLEVWKDIPVAVEEDPMASHGSQSQSNSSHKGGSECARDGQSPGGLRSAGSVPSESSSTITKSRFSVSRSPPPIASPIPTPRRQAPPRSCLPSSRNQKRNLDWGVGIAAPHASPPTAACEDINNKKREGGQGGIEGNATSNVEAKWMLFEKNGEDKAGKFGGLKLASRVVPVQEIGSMDLTCGSGNPTSKIYGNYKDGENDLSLIRMKLVQIENQQSSLLDLLQRFIGNSQNGIHSLEARVHGLELALNEISHDFALSSGRVSNNDPVVTCCKLPGAEFLSSKFWRRTEGRYPSRFSLSGDPTLPTVRTLAEKYTSETSKWDRQRFAPRGGFVVNPLAEIKPQSRGSSDVVPNKSLKVVTHSADVRHTDSKLQDDFS